MATIANPHGRLILVGDDEPTTLRSVTATLAIAGFRVMVAENGAAGLDAFLGAPDEIELVLTDVVMPVMDGIAMIEEIKKHRPNIRVVLMTGYSEPVIGTIYGAKYPLIRKPFLPDNLVRVVNANLNPPAAEA
jgi:DNA-binding NtrC family response regulator